MVSGTDNVPTRRGKRQSFPDISMKALIYIKIVMDERMVGTTAEIRMKQGFERWKVDVERESKGALSIAWSVVASAVFGQGDIEWTGYTYNGHPAYMPSATWSERINALYDAPNTYVILVFHPVNWKDPDHIIGGLNNFQTAILNPREAWSPGSWRITLEHECLHHFDNRGNTINWPAAIGKNNMGAIVKNWDNDVVHETWSGTTQHRNDFLYVWRNNAVVEALSTIYPYTEDMKFDLIKVGTREEQYVVIDGYRYWVLNERVLLSLKNVLNPLRVVTEAELAVYSDGGVIGGK